MNLSEAIAKHRQEIKSDKMDMSFGEIINMYNANEIIISPEYQRSFRWDVQKQTDFIESILLGIPFPSIFVAANEDGAWELIDGLQRISTVLSFFGELKSPEKNNLTLQTGGILTQLQGLTIKDIPIDLKLAIKRTPCRIEIIQKDSHFEMRYELFKRLNTGGEGLSRQEIRNCIFRGLSQYKLFIDAIEKNAQNEKFRAAITISKELEDMMYYEELCLRFFALNNFFNNYKENSIQDFFDTIMKQQCEQPDAELINSTFDLFEKIFLYLNQFEENVFKLARTNFSTSMFDSIVITLASSQTFSEIPVDDFFNRLEILKANADFKKFAGSASSNPKNIKNKLAIADKILLDKNNETTAN